MVEYNNEAKSFCLLINNLEPQFYELEFKFMESLFGKIKFKVGFKGVVINELEWETNTHTEELKIYTRKNNNFINVLNNYWDILVEIPFLIAKRMQFFYLLKCSRNARRVQFISHNDVIGKDFYLISQHTSQV